MFNKKLSLFKTKLLQRNTPKRTLLVGTGSAGSELAQNILRLHGKKINLLACVDDKPEKTGQRLHGIPILGTSVDIPKLVQEYSIEQIFLGIPTADRNDLARIIRLCDIAQIPTFTLPCSNELINCKIEMKLLRPFSIEDLLLRTPMSLDWSAMRNMIRQQIVLITGAGGFMGTELCRQVAQLNPKAIIALDHAEDSLFKLQQELLVVATATDIHYLPVNIQDQSAISYILQTQQPNIIIHAASYNHAHLLKKSIRETVKNNIFGTYTLAVAATQHNVKHFILLSSNQVVNPCHIVGLTKRVAEIICHSLGKHQPITKFITVRFGNIIGSAGSIVPKFQQQIALGEPVTVTHHEATRFFMSKNDAAQLILQSLAISNGGEIFVFDMGKSISILALAEQMIRIAGKKLGVNAKIKYVGLPPDEKLHEELFHNNEPLRPTSNRKIMQIATRAYPWHDLAAFLEQIEDCCKNYNIGALLALLSKLVPESNVAA